ncbi:hypothetical protein CXU10_02960 [Akkermansia muciniphila]|nr:hypothetical protein CXU10_02960 [Akkermansia muciniphila]
MNESLLPGEPVYPGTEKNLSWLSGKTFMKWRLPDSQGMVKGSLGPGKGKPYPIHGFQSPGVPVHFSSSFLKLKTHWKKLLD